MLGLSSWCRVALLLRTRPLWGGPRKAESDLLGFPAPFGVLSKCVILGDHRKFFLGLLAPGLLSELPMDGDINPTLPYLEVFRACDLGLLGDAWTFAPEYWLMARACVVAFAF